MKQPVLSALLLTARFFRHSPAAALISAYFCLPTAAQTGHKQDSVSAVIQREDLIQRQILQSETKNMPVAELLGKIAPSQAPSPAKLPVPTPAPRQSSARQEAKTAPPPAMVLPAPIILPAEAAPAGSPAPVFTAPIPIPAPLAAPEAAAPQTEDYYETPPQTPLAYPQKSKFLTNFPRFGDRRPHLWASRRKPWHYAVHGTDISWHNKAIDWSALARSRISFVFIKATEGGDHLDPSFSQNWQSAKAAGLARGAYHFYYFCRSAKDQLRWYIKNVPRDKYAMPPVLDIEWNHSSRTCRRHPPAAIVQQEMRVFLQGVERHYGKKPIIYTTVDFFHDNNLRAFRNYPFWLRSVAAHPDDRYKNHPWLFWQYTGTGRVPGMFGDADINVFGGDMKQWQAWLRAVQK